MVFMQREKLFKCVVSFQILHKHTQKKNYCKFVTKKLLGCFSEDIKMWRSHNVMNGLLYNIYVDSMGPYTNVNSLIF